MPWIDPGEFGRGAAAREDTRSDHARAVLEELLAAGWSAETAAEARRLHDATGAAVARWLDRCRMSDCNDTALGLVGEARGRALADWWATIRDLDDHTRRLVVECAGVAAAMALHEGYLLGRAAADARAAESRPAMPVPAWDPARHHPLRVNGALAARGL
jgi:hypothetical protein